MTALKIVAYYRVSTQRQGRSGLGLEAQRWAVTNYLNGEQWQLVSEHMEIEGGKRDDNRPELAAAMATCHLHGAKLVIAKLDRLSRDAHFLLGLQKSNVDFVAADMPDANKMTVGIMVLVAQNEREPISRRTWEALAAAKTQGKTLGKPSNLRNRELGSKRGSERNTAKAVARAHNLAPTIRQLQAEGVIALQDIAAALMAKGIPTALGKLHWQAVQVSRVLALMEVGRNGG